MCTFHLKWFCRQQRNKLSGEKDQNNVIQGLGGYILSVVRSGVHV